MSFEGQAHRVGRVLATGALTLGLAVTAGACSASDGNDGRTPPDVTLETPTTLPSELAFKDQDRLVFASIVQTYINPDVNPDFWNKLQTRFNDAPEKVAQYFKVSKNSTKIDGKPGNFDQLTFTYSGGDGNELFIDYIAPRIPIQSSLVNIVFRSPKLNFPENALKNIPPGLINAPSKTTKDGSRTRSFNGGSTGVLATLTTRDTSQIDSVDLLIRYTDGALRPALPPVAR